MKASIAVLIIVGVGGCARWEPQTNGPVVMMTRACPLKRAPAVSNYAKTGVRGVYHFVVEGASREDIAEFLKASQAKGFGVMAMTVNINGKDTLFATGPGLLRSQTQVDAAFDAACRLGRGKVFLTHVRFNVPDPERGSIRVR